MINVIRRYIINKFHNCLMQVFIVFPALLLLIFGCEKEVSRSPVEPDPSAGVIHISSNPSGAVISRMVETQED